MSLNNVILLLGSNINNPKKNIENAIGLIQQNVGAILNNSELITSKPVEFDSTNYFCNIAVCIKTEMSPIRLLKVLKDIEKKMGREKDSSYFGEYRDRIIDIDIVLYNNIKFLSAKLSIPHHKNLYERDFAKKIINAVSL